MKRLVLSTSIAACSVLAWTATAFGAKGDRKKQADAPAVVSVKPAVDTQPLQAELPSPWRTWSDAQGNKLEAQFCSLYGNILTVQTHEGKTAQMYLMNLVPADRAFAQDYAKRLRARAFADDYVRKAAYQIDYLIGSTLVSKGQKFNPPATDEQFVRRIYLDAVGRVPTADEASEFLADKAADKRAKLIDRLLYSPGYTMQMYNWMGDMLRVKDTFAKNVPAFTFQDWLKDQLHADRPWDSLVRAMLTADGKLCDNGATGFLAYDAQMPLDGVSNLLTTFLGANVACAQCHDHPLADWKQRDFYQMAAFFGASDGLDEKALNAGKKLAKNGGKGTPGLNKGLVQKIASANAYRQEDTTKQTLTFPKDYKYSDAKAGAPVMPTLISWSKNDAKSPLYRGVNTSNPVQLRVEFAKWMTAPENPRFAANIANRVWKKVFGLAVQEPVSDLDDPTRASNPALLAHLATVIKAGRFDLREFQRVLFNSQTYQRAASASPDLEKGPYLFPGPLVRRMTAEQVWDSLMVLSTGTDVDNITLRRGDDEKLMSLPGNAMTAENFKYVIERMQSSGAEMRGGGKKNAAVSKNLITEYQGGKPQQRHGMILARASELPQPAPETHFLRLFGQSDRLVADSATTDGSVPQALMLMNGGAGQLITDTNCAAVTAAEKAGSADEKVDRLYLSFLARKPTAEERPVATQALTTGLGISDVAWALVNTREFLFIQ